MLTTFNVAKLTRLKVKFRKRWLLLNSVFSEYNRVMANKGEKNCMLVLSQMLPELEM